MAEFVNFVDALLARGDLYEIRNQGRVVVCVLSIPARTAPALGANAAVDMGEWLITNVLQRRSRWLGLVMDVRGGPSIFGPVTRGVVERVFDSAERARKPLAILVGGGTSQRGQFDDYSRTVAPSYSTVTTDPDAALAWMTRTP